MYVQTGRRKMSSFVERYDAVMAEINVMRIQNTAKILRMREDQLAYDNARNIYDMQVTAARIESVNFDNLWCKLVEELDVIGRESYVALDKLVDRCGVLDEPED